MSGDMNNPEDAQRVLVWLKQQPEDALVMVELPQLQPTCFLVCGPVLYLGTEAFEDYGRGESILRRWFPGLFRLRPGGSN